MGNAETVRADGGTPRLTGAAWAVYLLGLRLTSRVIYGGNRWVGEQTGYSRRSVQLGVAALVGAGLVRREIRGPKRDLFFGAGGRNSLRPPAQTAAPSLRPIRLGSPHEGKNVAGLPQGATEPEERGSPEVTVEAQIADLERLVADLALPAAFRREAERQLAELRGGACTTPGAAAGFRPFPQPGYRPRKADRPAAAKPLRAVIGEGLLALPGAERKVVERLAVQLAELWCDASSLAWYRKALLAAARGELRVGVITRAWEAARELAPEHARRAFTRRVSSAMPGK